MCGRPQGGLRWMLVAQTAAGFLLASAGRLTIATYNVENYLATDRMAAGEYHRAYPKPEAEKTALRAVIRALDADVLVLQEMGSDGYLEELRRDLKADGLDYPHAAAAEAADAERHVAVLSRIPFRRTQTHADLDFPYFGGRAKVKRGLLEVVVPLGGGDLALFAVHLRSRFTERRDDPEAAVFRAGEAGAIRDFLLRRFPDPASARFVLLGDCNDTRDSKPLRLLTRRGATRILTMLGAVDRNGESWTYHYGKDDTYSRIDYILASPGLAPAIPLGAARVFDGPGVGEASDHRPVVFSLDLAPTAPSPTPGL